MTLTAFAIRPDEIEIVTDSLSSGPAAVFTMYDVKQRHFPLQDALVHSRGAAWLGRAWEHDREQAVMQAGADFDSWHDDARRTLPELWMQYQQVKAAGTQYEDGGATSAGRIFHFGWSDERGRFVAIEYNPDDGFTGNDWTDHDGVWSWAPPPEPQPAPADDQGWIAYVEKLMDHRADPQLALREAWLVGGELVHTRLRRGEIVTRRIHRFPFDWRFRRQFIGSLHYIGQLGPCLCGSGQPLRICHLAFADRPENNKPCPCDSGDLFRDCCLIDPNDEAAQTYWFQHLDDFDRDRDAYRAAWLANQPDDPLLASGFEPQDVIGEVRRQLDESAAAPKG